jgi:hypothetical protein
MQLTPSSGIRAFRHRRIRNDQEKMPITSLTRVFKLTRFFPPHDPLATKIARLCILRKDFRLEMEGVFAERIIELDGHSEEWRRLYFVRNLIRTLREIGSGMRRLLSDSEFKILLAAQKQEVHELFEEHTASLDDGIGVLKEVRDEICAHVQERPVQEALNEIANSDLCGILETGPTLQQTYYKFAGALVVQILVRGATDRDQFKVFVDKMEKIGALVHAFALIDRALFIYLEARGLLLRQQR